MFPVRDKPGNLKFIILIILATAIVLTGVYFLNDIVLTIRLTELQALIRESNRELSRSDFLAMAAKFKLFLQLYKGTIDEKKLDEEELNMIYLSTSYEVRSKITLTKYSEAAKPVIAIINIIRFLLGKPPIGATIDNRTDAELSIAYYFERNKQYRKALSVYDEAFSNNKVLDDKVPVVLLHQGFCNGVIGDYGTAKSLFIRIIKKYYGADESTAAALMLQYLETFLSEIDNVKKSTDSAISRAQKLFMLMAYDEALSVLEKSGDDGKDRAQKKFIEARCREETGDKDSAAKIYQDIIRNDHESETAKDSNRRLLVISTSDDKAQKLKELAKKNNELIKDPGFEHLVETSDKIKSNRDDLNLDDKKYLDQKIDSDKTENTTDRNEFDTFVNDSIKTTEETVALEKSETSLTPEPVTIVIAVPTPRPSSPPVVKKTASPTPAAALTPVPAATQAKPFTKSYKDEKGNITKLESYDAEGNIEMTIYYEYDDRGNPVKIRVYDKNGRPMED
jgi:tetratricopeptide (TPR) repeat protein